MLLGAKGGRANLGLQAAARAMTASTAKNQARRLRRRPYVTKHLPPQSCRLPVATAAIRPVPCGGNATAGFRLSYD